LIVSTFELKFYYVETTFMLKTEFSGTASFYNSLVARGVCGTVVFNPY
jgi:putative methionine-R-sulfoxide reductase with GAF domain